MDNQSQVEPPTGPGISQNTQNFMGPSLPQPIGGLASPPRGNTTKGLGIKFAYIIVGLVGMALTLAALKKAVYYESVCLEKVKEDLAKYSEEGIDKGRSCEEYTPRSYDACKYLETQYNSIPAVHYPACPSKWLVEPQIYMLALVWGVCTLVLVGTFIANRNQQSGNTQFSQIDSLVLWATGGITSLCAFCMMIFFVWLVSSDHWCSDGRLKVNAENLLRSKSRGYDEDKNYKSLIRGCSDYNREIYQPWLLLFGTLFAGAAGIIAIVGGFMVRGRKSMTGQGMMATGGGQYNNLGLQNNNVGMGMIANRSMAPYQQTSQMGSQYPQSQQQYGYGNQYHPQNMQMMGQQQQQYA